MSLLELASGAAGREVLLVHGLGGSALGYRELAARLGRPCLGVQARGLDGLEEPLDCVEALAAAYVDDVVARAAPTSWLLAGWSFGGLVAFEMTRQLARTGRRACAVLLDTRALIDGEGAPTAPESPAPAGDRLAAAIRETEQAHRSATARYRPGPTPAALLVIRATEPPRPGPEALGFAGLARGPLTTLAVPSTHDGLLVPPAVDRVAPAMAEFFARWERR